MDRIQFFKKLTACAIDLVEFPTRDSNTVKDSKNPSCVRPPGAHPQENVFLSLCTGCDACMEACPVNAITIDNPERREPFLQQEENPCILCPGTPCISVCPTGALDKKFGRYLRDVPSHSKS